MDFYEYCNKLSPNYFPSLIFFYNKGGALKLLRDFFHTKYIDQNWINEILQD